MRRQEVTMAHLTPAMGQILTEAVPDAPADEDALAALGLPGRRHFLARLDVARG